MQSRCPAFRIGFHRDIERGLETQRCCHRLRSLFSICGDPALQQPRRQIEHLRFDLVDQRLAFTCATAQHGVDKSRILCGAAIRLHQPHRKIDGGVVGNIHHENLCRADQEGALRAGRIGRHAAIHQARQHMAERAEPPQDCRHQPAHQGAVAVRKRFQSGMSGRTVELLVEHAVLVQNTVQNIGRNPARCEASDLGGRNETRRLHEQKISAGRITRKTADGTSVAREYAKCKNRFRQVPDQVLEYGLFRPIRC